MPQHVEVIIDASHTQSESELLRLHLRKTISSVAKWARPTLSDRGISQKRMVDINQDCFMYAGARDTSLRFSTGVCELLGDQTTILVTLIGAAL